MSAATVVVSSAEGAGDMPSSAPVVGADSPEDGAQPFSEVLSLSSPDHPGTSAPSSSPPPSAAPDEAHAQSDAAVATVPEVPSAGHAGGPQARAQRRAAASERDDGHVPRAVGSPPLTRAPSRDRIIPSGSSEGQAGDIAIDVDRSLGATRPLGTSATPAAPGSAVRSTTAIVSTASDGTAASTARAGAPGGDDDVLATLIPAQDGGSDPSTVASSATHAPRTHVAGSTGDNEVPAGVTAGGIAEVRALADRGTAPGSVGLRPGQVRILANGSAPGAGASALSAAAPGNPSPASVSAEGLSELAEFPDAGEATAGLDISDLAASISRPLAGGSGDYSVQVSLHPPELGEVRALLSLQGDVLHVTLTPDHSTGFDALSDAMPALHEQLAGGGVEVHVTLGHPGDAEGGDGRGASEPGPAGRASSDDATASASTSAVPMTTTGPGRIHLVL
jgi:hypothetical protein